MKKEIEKHVKNNQNITIDEIKKYFEPEIHDSNSKITNLSDQKLGYYAYLLQKLSPKEVSDIVLESNDVLCNKLEYHTLDMKDIEVYNKPFDFPKGVPNQDFCLFFRVWIGGIGYPIAIKNGFLLKCLHEASISSFDDLIDYKVAVIYNPLRVNSEISCFVKFSMKPEMYNYDDKMLLMDVNMSVRLYNNLKVIISEKFNKKMHEVPISILSNITQMDIIRRHGFGKKQLEEMREICVQAGVELNIEAMV